MATTFEIKTNKVTEEWISRKWRPAMGWMYMVVCIFDFIVFPILWSLLQSLLNGEITDQWDPLTLQGAGLFHIAMGAVLGIAAYGRTQEKINGVLPPSAPNPNNYNYQPVEDYEPNEDYGYNIPQPRKVKRPSFANNATPIPQHLVDG